LETTDILEGPQKGFLRRVFRRLPIREKAPASVKHVLAVPREEFRE
jgi:hypothetical protein